MIPLNRLGAAVAGPLGREVAQVGVLPLAQGPPEPGDLGDRAGGERRDDLLGDLLPGGQVTGGVGGADLLVALPGDQDLVVGVAAAQAVDQPVPLPVGQVVRAGAQDVADTVERVVLVPAVPQGVLLDAAADLIQGLPGEPTMWNASSTGVASPSSSRSALAYPRNGSNVATCTHARNCSLRSFSHVAKTVPERPGTRSSNRAWTFPSWSRVRSTIPVSIVGPLTCALCGVWCHTCSSTPT